MIDKTRELISTIYELFSCNHDFNYIKAALINSPILTDEFLALNKELSEIKYKFRTDLNALSGSLEEMDGVIRECKMLIIREEKNRETGKYARSKNII